VTALLVAWRNGDQRALERLIPLVHRELRRVARAAMRGERTDHTLEPTALVNEAYIRLAGLRRLNWQDRAHFLAVSARVMRQILIDYARARRFQKRGGGAIKVTLDTVLVAPEPGRDLVALDEALGQLAEADARKGRVVELRFFGGLTVEESAAVLGVSVDTVMRDWKFARAWLLRELKGRPSSPSGSGHRMGGVSPASRDARGTLRAPRR
jgi:RNA polymerase sigma factor (TIGR02999 family)